MARNTKDTFILRHDFAPQIKLLSTEQRGVLFTAIYAYELGEEMPEMDPLVAICFGFIKSSLDANMDKYEAKCEANRANGTKGGRPSQNNRTVLEENPKNRTVLEENPKNRTVLEEKPKNPTETLGFSKNPIDIDSDIDFEFESDFDSESVSVSVSESDSRGDAEREKERFFEIFFFMNFQNPASEVDRFVNHYSANGWCRKGSTTPVKDRIALARTWQQEAKNAPPRFPPEFLPNWQLVYTEAKARDSTAAKVMLTDLTAVEITPLVIRLYLSERLRQLIEGNLEFFRDCLLNRFHAGKRFFYVLKS